MTNGESTDLSGVEDPRYAGFPPGFFKRVDPSSDQNFYSEPRMVTHIDSEAISAVGELYQELQLTGKVLDIMSSWISHFVDPPTDLTVLGMNEAELAENKQATSWVRHDLNMNPKLPFEDGSFDSVVCCVSVDYLVRPIEVFDEVHRCLKTNGVFVNSFSNRCFPTKAIRGWGQTDDRGHVSIVGEYYRLTGPWVDVRAELRTSSSALGDPLFAVWGSKK